MTKPRAIVLFAFGDCQLLDVAGPASVFGAANSSAGRMVYDVRIVSPGGGPQVTSCGVGIDTLAPRQINPLTVDTLLVAGGALAAMRASIEPPAARRWLKRTVQSARRFGSVCSGAFILAELGELDGIRVATHWASCDELATRFPVLRVDANALFVASGKAWTSAGVSTGIDMALAMVEQDVGPTIANRVARFLVLHARRPGYQSQFSELLSVQAAAGPRFAELMTWVEERLAKRIDVASMASRARMSERTFYRRFLADTGQTPAQFVENARLDRVRTLLATNLPLKTIAARSGMSSLARMSAAFKRKFGLSPTTFRHMQAGGDPEASGGPRDRSGRQSRSMVRKRVAAN